VKAATPYKARPTDQASWNGFLRESHWLNTRAAKIKLTMVAPSDTAAPSVDIDAADRGGSDKGCRRNSA
jgi:hypothetical protein